jgi:hypothetical protein
MADLLIDWSEVDRFLQLLGRSADSADVHALVFPPKGGPGHDKGAHKLKLDAEGRQSVERLLSMPLYARHALGIRPNPGGAKAAEIAEGVALFMEADGGLPLEAQEALPELIGLPSPTFTVWTGGKSLHLYWCAKEGGSLSPQAWRKAQERLIAAVEEVAPEAGVDRSIKDPSRVMRAPGSIHPATGERCRIHSESGERYDLAGLVDLLPKGLRVPQLPAEHCANVPTEKVRETFIRSIAPQLKRGGIDLRSAASELRKWREWHPEAFQNWEELCWKHLQLSPEWVDQVVGTLEPKDPEKDQRKALEALAFLPPLDFTSYDKWLSVGMALHSVSEVLLPSWIDWSRGMGEAFNEEESRAKWETFTRDREGGLGLGSLIHLAKGYGYRPPLGADTPSRYTAGPSGPSAPSAPNQSTDSADAKEPRNVRALPLPERMDLMREKAEALMGDPSVPSLDRLPVLRERASELDLPLRDGELAKLLWQARRNLSAPAEALGAGDLLDFTPTPWLWEGLLMREAVNLVVALPKVGKTSLLLEAISSWHRGEAFLGRKFHGECPPVLIVGSDQPQSDWGRMLQRVGLVSEERRLLEPIVGLFHSGAPLALDAEGIERIASYAKAHPGLLVVIDSYARCVAPLGLSERDAEIAEPLADLQEALGSSGASIVVIHHSNKSARNESASLASRGSTALPAACSQILHLQRLEAPEGGQQSPLSGKRMLSTEGRGGAPEKFLLELSEEGRWLCRGDGDALLREEERQRAVGALNDRQASALEHVEEVWEQTGGRQGVSADLLASLMELRGADTSRAARRLLDQLAQRGLVRKRIQSEGKDRALVARYVPTSADLLSADPMDPPLPLGADGADGPDGPAHKREEVSAPAEEVSMDSADAQEIASVGLFESVEVRQGGFWCNGWVVASEEGEELELFRSDDPSASLFLARSLVRPCRS